MRFAGGLWLCAVLIACGGSDDEVARSAEADMGVNTPASGRPGATDSDDDAGAREHPRPTRDAGPEPPVDDGPGTDEFDAAHDADVRDDRDDRDEANADTSASRDADVRDDGDLAEADTSTSLMGSASDAFAAGHLGPPVELVELASDPDSWVGDRAPDQWLSWETRFRHRTERMRWKYWYRHDGSLERKVLEGDRQGQVFIYDERGRLKYRCTDYNCEYRVWLAEGEEAYWHLHTDEQRKNVEREVLFFYATNPWGPPLRRYELVHYGPQDARRIGIRFAEVSDAGFLHIVELGVKEGFPVWKDSFRDPDYDGTGLSEGYNWEYDDQGRLRRDEDWVHSAQDVLSYDSFGYLTAWTSYDIDPLASARFSYDRNAQGRVARSTAVFWSEQWPEGDVVVETDWAWEGDQARLTHRQVGGSEWTGTDLLSECAEPEPTIERDGRGFITAIVRPCGYPRHEFARGGQGPADHVRIPLAWAYAGPQLPSMREPALPVHWSYRDAALQRSEEARAAMRRLINQEAAAYEDTWAPPEPISIESAAGM